MHNLLRLLPLRWYLHLSRLAARGTLVLVATVVVESLLISIAISETMVHVLGFSDQSTLAKYSRAELIVMALFVAPILETVFLQAIPVAIVRWLDLRDAMRWIVIVTPFAVGHFYNSFTSGVSAGIVAGAYFGVCYWIYRRQSYWRAIVVTTCVHFLRNAIACSLL